MRQDLVDERLAMVIPEEYVHYLKVRGIYNSLQSELEGPAKAQLNQLMEIMASLEGNLIDKCVEADKESQQIDLLHALGGYA